MAPTPAPASPAPEPPTETRLSPLPVPASEELNQPTEAAPTTNQEPTPATTNLRDYLLAALATHPGTRIHHLHAIVSVPRRTSEPFPFATPRTPRVWMQDILVLLSEQGLDEEGSAGDGGQGRASTPPPGGRPVAGAQGPRVLTTGISAALYLIPATASGILYISKVDTTGQARVPSPAGALVRALVGFFADPATRPVPAREVVQHLWVHVFARAQAQYLFSASKEAPGKKPLGDTQLCAWWRRALGRVGRELAGREGVRVRMNYVLPGFSEQEAANALRGVDAGEGWVYGHPYALEGVPLPCPQPAVAEETATTGQKRKGAAGGLNLGCVIPSFDDDPKSRFMDEIAYTTDGEIRSPQPKRAKTQRGEEEAGRALGELWKVGADEFWERMSFRQECVAGAVTGFFTLVVSGGAATAAGAAAVVPGGQMGQVSGQVHKRILTTLLEGVEFSTTERAAKATETVEGAIRGLCLAAVGPATPVRGTAGEAAAAAVGTEGLFGSVVCRNAGMDGRGAVGEAVVRVLAVRRKRKA